MFFSKKPNIWQLMNCLSNEESIIKKRLFRRIRKWPKKMHKFRSIEYMSCLPFFINYFDNIKGNSQTDRKKIKYLD